MRRVNPHYQNRRQKVFNRGLCVSAGVAWHSKNWQNFRWYIVSCFNLGGLGALFGGLSPPKPPVATGLPITNPKRQFCQWRNHKNSHNARKKLYSNETSTWWEQQGEKINKKQLNLYKLSITINGMDAHADFRTYLPFVNSYEKTEHKRYTQYFSKRIGFLTWLSILRTPLHRDMLCKRPRVYK